MTSAHLLSRSPAIARARAFQGLGAAKPHRRHDCIFLESTCATQKTAARYTRRIGMQEQQQEQERIRTRTKNRMRRHYVADPRAWPQETTASGLPRRRAGPRVRQKAPASRSGATEDRETTKMTGRCRVFQLHRHRVGPPCAGRELSHSFARPASRAHMSGARSSSRQQDEYVVHLAYVNSQLGRGLGPFGCRWRFSWTGTCFHRARSPVAPWSPATLISKC